MVGEGGISQKKLSDELNVGQTQISGWENYEAAEDGKTVKNGRRPSSENISKLAQYFGEDENEVEEIREEMVEFYYSGSTNGVS